MNKLNLEDIIKELEENRVNYGTECLLHTVFERQAKLNPDNVAVIFKDEKLTYKELDEKSNQVAWFLRGKGVRPDDVIPMIFERSFEMMISILGILKAGGAYLPISPSNPPQRIDYIIKDSKAKLVLMLSKYETLVETSVERFFLDKGEGVSNEIKSIPCINKVNDLAYVIYTSGSTGKPKGVMIEHKAVINRIDWMQRKYILCPKDVILHKTPYVFDVSVWELFWWSFTGASVYLLEPGNEVFPQAIIKAIYKNQVTIMHFVPSALSGFLNYVSTMKELDDLKTLRRVFSSGEELLPIHVNKFNKLLYKANNTALTNLYGPTEATVDVSYFDCPSSLENAEIPIGKAIQNTALFIMKDGKIQPLGVEGELIIAGDCLARGYLNNEALTAEKFPKLIGEKAIRIYKTGDIAKVLEDGNIKFLGRMDHQVKIRGLRIELGEIEAAIMGIDSIDECTVIVDKSNENMVRMKAFLVGRKKLEIKWIRDYLKSNLPSYMIPNDFIWINNMPRTTSGKIDRGLLARGVK